MAQELKIEGPTDTAMQVNGETELLCQVYYVDDNGEYKRAITQPYNVTWFFTAENSTDSKVNIKVSGYWHTATVYCLV